MDKLGVADGCEVGQSLTEGLSEGCPLGEPDKEGPLDGCALGLEDGIEVGQSDTEGLIEGSLLGDPEACTLGQLLGFSAFESWAAAFRAARPRRNGSRIVNINATTGRPREPTMKKVSCHG